MGCSVQWWQTVRTVCASRTFGFACKNKPRSLHAFQGHSNVTGVGRRSCEALRQHNRAESCSYSRDRVLVPTRWKIWGVLLGAGFASVGLHKHRDSDETAAEGRAGSIADIFCNIMGTLGMQTHCDVTALSSQTLRHAFRYMISEAVEKAAGSVVKITCVKGDGYWQLYESAGSGFVIDEASILTNAHVIEGAVSLKVTLPNGEEIEARVNSHDSLSDIALVTVASNTRSPLLPAKIGKSSELRVGEWIAVLGSPGTLQNTVTVGIVSALVRLSSELGMGPRRMGYVQTDAPINQGNSGGPMVNLDGEVVGIASMKASHLDGVGFAIPIDTAMDIVKQLRKNGKVLRPYLGLKMVTLTPDVVSQLRHEGLLPTEVVKGVLIARVAANGPAATAGLRDGDVLQEIDGMAVTEAGQIYNMLGLEAGKRISLKVLRFESGRTKVLNCKVTTQAAQQ